MSTAQPYVAFRAGSDLTATKDELRRAILAARERRTPRERELAAVDLAQVVGDLTEVRTAHVVAAYASRGGEPDTTPLLERLLGRGTRVLLPLLGAGLTRRWGWLTATTDLEVRAPGRPPEPPGPALPAETLADAEVVLAPALAVDTSGTRLGHGGGWYDRVLAHARPGTPVIALVYPEEVYDAAALPLPREPHDRPVDSVATTAGWRPLG